MTPHSPLSPCHSYSQDVLDTIPSVASISELSIICCPFGYFKKEIKDTKGVIRIRKSKKERQHNGAEENGQREKQRSTKHT
jgi:hypothetical protein